MMEYLSLYDTVSVDVVKMRGDFSITLVEQEEGKLAGHQGFLI